MISPIVEDVQPPRAPQEAVIVLTWLTRAKEWSYLNFLQILNTFAMIAILQVCLQLQMHSPGDTSSNVELSHYYGVVWNIYASIQERPFIDILVSQSKCQSNYEAIKLSEAAHTFRLHNSSQIKSDRLARTPVYKFFGYYWCGKRVTYYTLYSHQMGCPTGYIHCDSGYCVIDEMCPVTRISISLNPLEISLSRIGQRNPVIGIEIHPTKHPCAFSRGMPCFDSNCPKYQYDPDCDRFGEDQYLKRIAEGHASNTLEHDEIPEEYQISTSNSPKIHLFARHTVDVAQDIQCHIQIKNALKKHLTVISEALEWQNLKGDEFDQFLLMCWIMCILIRAYEICQKIPFTAPRSMLIQTIFGLSIFPTLVVSLFIKKTINVEAIESQLKELEDIQNCFGAVSWNNLMKTSLQFSSLILIAENNQYSAYKIHALLAFMVITIIIARLNRRV